MWPGEPARRFRPRISAALAVALAMALAGCGSSPTRITVSIVGAEDLNPDADGQPKPLVVRMYELKSDAAFKAATFDDLTEGDIASLGAERPARVRPLPGMATARPSRPSSPAQAWRMPRICKTPIPWRRCDCWERSTATSSSA